jgi:MFS family permease
MNASTSSIGEMVNQSIVVLTKPGVSTFEQYERSGTMRDGIIYVGAAALLAGLVGFVFGFLGGFSGALAGLIGGALGPLVGYLIFAYAVFFIGKNQGGTGTQDEVFYSTALYAAPLLAIVGVVSAIPIVGCLLLPVSLLLGLYQIYLAYLMTRAAMNLGQTPAIITVVLAWIAQFVIGLIIAGVLGGIGLAAAQ